MALFRETADVSVRPAVAGDESAVTDVQVSSWRATGVLGEGVIQALDVPAMRDRWASAITAPPGPGFAVLVALDGPDVVGFAAVSPGQVLSLEVLPEAQRAGHGSRLLAAAVDRLRADGSETVTTWALADDTARAAFLAASGLGEDGRSRTLATGPREVVEHRWSAQI
ncbi:GNAT family N-acetyltransferase [Promicromonospora thailandica]|uniref:L-amino acid N-acyltransferase YncA n=1 Tax=Promicromonospora thailandica TaxID=765201 RepID=A0A9X2G8I8_9MICO|nr:GNAT family N-acetyltransferase [Promicromonospora thailandica]MCP2263871.1 L-amino acid N-acyltransferase YncA [Promicromonospora thailandica]